MTPLSAATILESWAAKAKTDETRSVCELAAIGMRNSVKSRAIHDASGAGELVLHYLRDEEGEMWIAHTRNGPTVGARTLSDALDGLMDKIEKGEKT